MRELFIILLLSIFTSSLFAQGHLSFKGIPIDGNEQEFVSRLEAAGFTYNAKLSNKKGWPVLIGSFSGMNNCQLHVFASNDVVFRVILFSDDYSSWDSVNLQYKLLKESLAKKYGQPFSDESFNSPYCEGDGHELSAIKKGEGIWMSYYESSVGRISLNIHSSPQGAGFISISYETKTKKTISSSGKNAPPLNYEDHSRILPTKSEIESTNARLPVLVSEGTMWTKVEYDMATKTERFYYKLTQPVDERIITPSVLNQLKTNMKNALRQNSSSMKRVNAGMTYLYLYYSSDNRKLYEIKINKSDF